MNYINLTSNRTIRNAVMAADFMAMFVITIAVEKYGHGLVYRPNVLLFLSFISLLLAQVGFSTILHHHYASIDRVLGRCTALVFTYGLMLTVATMTGRWLDFLIAKGIVVAEISLLLYVVVIVMRIIEHLSLKVLRKRGRNTRNIVFVGKPERVEEIMQDIDTSATTGLRFNGYYAPEMKQDIYGGLKYLGGYGVLEQMMGDGERLADEVYCALPPEEKELSKKLIRHCMHTVTNFYYVPLFIDEVGDYLRPSMVGEQVVFANFTEPLLDPSNRLMKRVFDVVCSGLALLCLLPFFPIVAIIIKCSSPGPVFFKQARTGLGGKDFMMLKFRSMHVNKDADKIQATKNDPRKFPFGNFMRKTSIDELPQLWNIFIGDMSIVGPRPHMRKHTDEYSTLIDDYMMRHYVKPGLTGWAQTTGFRGETQELWQMEGRVKRDIWYIQNWSFWLDIRIIFRTVKQVIWKDKQAY